MASSNHFESEHGDISRLSEIGGNQMMAETQSVLSNNTAAYIVEGLNAEIEVANNMDEPGADDKSDNQLYTDRRLTDE